MIQLASLDKRHKSHSYDNTYVSLGDFADEVRIAITMVAKRRKESPLKGQCLWKRSLIASGPCGCPGEALAKRFKDSKTFQSFCGKLKYMLVFFTSGAICNWKLMPSQIKYQVSALLRSFIVSVVLHGFRMSQFVVISCASQQEKW